MIIITLIGLLMAFLYYDSINKAEDPRVLSAKKLLKTSNKLIDEQNYLKASIVLDQIEDTYKKIPSYDGSYELGVINNDKAAIYLLQVEEAILATGDLKIDDLEIQKRKNNLELAQKYTLKSIKIYEAWLERFDSLEESEMTDYVKTGYLASNLDIKQNQLEKIINKRIKDMLLAQKETPRRLSVSYTNYGVICRYLGQTQTAINCYQKAVEFWPENFIAENNLRVLKGEPMKKRSIIKTLFPPDRKK